MDKKIKRRAQRKTASSKQLSSTPIAKAPSSVPQASSLNHREVAAAKTFRRENNKHDNDSSCPSRSKTSKRWNSWSSHRVRQQQKSKTKPPLQLMSDDGEIPRPGAYAVTGWQNNHQEDDEINVQEDQKEEKSQQGLNDEAGTSSSPLHIIEAQIVEPPKEIPIFDAQELILPPQEKNKLKVGELSWQLVFHVEPCGKEFQQTINFHQEHRIRPREFWNFIGRRMHTLEIPNGVAINQLEAEFQSASTHMVIVDELVSAINNRHTIHKSSPFQHTVQVPSERSLKVYQLAVRVPGCTIKTDVVTLVTSPDTTLKEVPITARIFKGNVINKACTRSNFVSERGVPQKVCLKDMFLEKLKSIVCEEARQQLKIQSSKSNTIEMNK